MLRQLRPAIAIFVLLTIVTGVLYPAVVTLLAQAVFPEQARGSLLKHNGQAIGSELIAQPFTNDRYFWPRPSAANYDASASSGSNLGPSNPALAEAVAARASSLRGSGAGAATPVPADLIAASGSGLDPHISIAAAEFQVARIAGARELSDADIRQLIRDNTEHPTLGLLGESRVNVLRLNLQLDHALDAASEPTEHIVGWKARGFLPDPR